MSINVQTNQVLFPGPGVTKQTVKSQSLSASASGGSTDLETELAKARARGRKLFIAVILLAAATGLMLFSLILSCLRSRKPPPAHAAYMSRGVFEKASEEQGHTYDNPFNPEASSKKGGYAPVET